MKKTEPKYKNIPVKPDVYQAVQLIAEGNGLGERGLGAQVARWAARELPECPHPKVPVSIETFPNSTKLIVSSIIYGYYCETCKRVYRHVASNLTEEFSPADREKLLKAVMNAEVEE